MTPKAEAAVEAPAEALAGPRFAPWNGQGADGGTRDEERRDAPKLTLLNPNPAIAEIENNPMNKSMNYFV